MTANQIDVPDNEQGCRQKPQVVVLDNEGAAYADVNCQRFGKKLH